MSHSGDARTQAQPRRFYVPVKYKLILALAGAFAWCGFSAWVAQPWISQLADLTSPLVAWIIIVGVALLPGLASGFVLAGLLLDSRPRYATTGENVQLPPLTVLIAAYNEERTIEETLTSITRQDYPARIEAIVVDDGSADDTAGRVRAFLTRAEYSQERFRIRLVQAAKNGGKARALNMGFGRASHDFIVTVDADSYLYRNALRNLAGNLVQGPPRTAAVDRHRTGPELAPQFHHAVAGMGLLPRHRDR